MNTLIEISEQVIDQETVQTVNARDLHAFLEINSKFADWIIRRIKECNFQENRDFIFTLLKNEKRKNIISKEYYLTLDMAKHLSMIERNEKGHEARQYFNFLFDNMSILCLLSNQVPKKHLKCIADGLPKQFIFRTLKALTHYMRVAYSGFVGCSYAIQYPYGKSVTTDYAPCFLAPGTLFECH
ncbi:antA/AntB antirepressor family protein [Bartonella henselae]|uniref:antA/AntB antirepressor family protein n=1 Tax=Bartonella henselae TaxID=38323 RepID=UPI00095D614F|nr:antA/AntB antirepressor family protein [Bartonella henselae]OLL50240.1 antirepressor [Bartonella henselae]UJM32714.1 antA/AntB antirepressor family protein [Bartonella henselae]UJM42966.1 antA/AntB antirepressor family protein [Bartonella henselae]